MPKKLFSGIFIASSIVVMFTFTFNTGVDTAFVCSSCFFSLFDLMLDNVLLISTLAVEETDTEPKVETVVSLLPASTTTDVITNAAPITPELNSNINSNISPLVPVVDTEIVARRVGSGLATAGLGGVGTGIGLVFSGLIKGFSRNPSLKDDLFSYAIFGFALTEAIGLFALMMAFMLLYA